MKTRHLTSFIAIGALLPLAAWGDDAGSKNAIQREAYDPRPSETRSGAPTPRVDETRDRTSTRAQTDMDASQTTSSHGTSAGIQCVSKDQLEHRVTATDLIGTKVLDREGREIGKVKDIGIGAVAPQLSEARPASRDSDSSSTGERSSGLSQPWTQSGEREARVFVRPDRALDAGDALVAIPATQLHREGDALRVDISREELRSIVADRASSRVSMNE